MEERLAELEIRVAFQDQTLHELNEVITRQQNQIDRLLKEVENLKIQMNMLAPSMVVSKTEEKPPPHY
ncbi:MAG: SlyX family protein [Gammaproteobacteria bacterium]|nr:SlyX family protein [Gammaproteobacteria bacterium]